MAENTGNFPTSSPSSSKTVEVPAASGSCGRLFSQFKELLDSAEAKVTGYDELHSSLQKERRSVEQLQGALLAQQQQLDACAKQDSLVERLTRQLEMKSYALEALEAKLQRQGLQYETAQVEASASHKELGKKRKRIEELESDSVSKQRKIQQLEQEVQGYRGICSYVSARTQRLEHRFGPCSTESLVRPHTLSPVEGEGNSPGPAATSSHALGSGATATPDNSAAEGAAGLLAMTSTADKPDLAQFEQEQQQQSSEEEERPQYFIPGNMKLTNREVGCQELRSDFVSRRASCVIIGRHPDAPREVRVACRQLIGILLLADCCQQLKIRVPSLANKLFSPSEFEAAAGCSKGKNWKANIKVLGSNGRNQMLKVWLPGLMQLVGDHSKTAVAKDSSISSLLDAETGLRIQADE